MGCEFGDGWIELLVVILVVFQQVMYFQCGCQLVCGGFGQVGLIVEFGQFVGRFCDCVQYVNGFVEDIDIVMLFYKEIIVFCILR